MKMNDLLLGLNEGTITRESLMNKHGKTKKQVSDKLTKNGIHQDKETGRFYSDKSFVADKKFFFATDKSTEEIPGITPKPPENDEIGKMLNTTKKNKKKKALKGFHLDLEIVDILKNLDNQSAVVNKILKLEFKKRGLL